MACNESLSLLDLPEDIIEMVVSYLTYHESSESRAICKLFNKHCQQRMNKGFTKIDKLHAQIQKEVKNKLPRRESERRNHPLARHVDILSAIETRLSLLGMSYMKYIDTGLCCFIPGKVLDELNSILRQLQSSNQPPRSHEFLQELRDISSMAMEHFDEKIAPALKTKLPAVTLPYPFSESCACPLDPSPGTSSTLFTFQSSPVRAPSIRSEVTSLGVQLRTQSAYVQQMKKEVTETKVGFAGQKKKLLDQEKKIVQQGQVISELEKKVNDLNQKFVDLSSELIKMKSTIEGTEGKKTIPCLHSEEFARLDNSDIDNSETVRKGGKSLKRKPGAATESRAKKSKR